eukprot:362509_1
MAALFNTCTQWFEADQIKWMELLQKVDGNVFKKYGNRTDIVIVSCVYYIDDIQTTLMEYFSKVVVDIISSYIIPNKLEIAPQLNFDPVLIYKYEELLLSESLIIFNVSNHRYVSLPRNISCIGPQWKIHAKSDFYACHIIQELVYTELHALFPSKFMCLATKNTVYRPKIKPKPYQSLMPPIITYHCDYSRIHPFARAYREPVTDWIEDDDDLERMLAFMRRNKHRRLSLRFTYC